MRCLFAACLALASSAAAWGGPPSTLAITHINVIDATGSPPKADMTVIVKDGHIVALGKKTTETHNEVVLMSGSLGFSTLICLLNNGFLYGTNSTGENGAGDVFAVTQPGAKTLTTLTSSPNPSADGQTVVFTATVTSNIGVPPDGETLAHFAVVLAAHRGKLAALDDKVEDLAKTVEALTDGGPKGPPMIAWHELDGGQAAAVRSDLQWPE